jgi:hypothetical protein
VDARDRFVTALAEHVNLAYYREGDIFLDVREIEAIGHEQEASDEDMRTALAWLDEQGLLEQMEGGHSYSNGAGLALRYEQEADRPLYWQHNDLRRRILKLAAEAHGRGDDDLYYRGEEERFIEAPWAETYAASQTLAHLGLLEVYPYMGHSFRARITPLGYEVQRDNRELANELPTSAAEDEDATANVAADALRDVILSVEGLLDEREWGGAARELQVGDEQYREGHWTDAVREYYRALESGLKHRLDELSVTYGGGAALNDLAKLAATNDLIPVNYQAMFGFVDTIRSPRSHGAGGNVEEVEIGQAEALLMGNHVRTLLLYLGQRPG